MHSKKIRKLVNRRKKQAAEWSQFAETNIEKFVFGRMERLKSVRRFVSAWLIFWLLLTLITAWQLAALSSYYQTDQPVAGGIYNEGILGTLSNLNPIYATSEVDTSLSRLIFAGLFTFNDHNQLVGDLASSYTINSDGTIYTVYLKPHLTWQDGTPLTAADAVYTFNTIENVDAQSPLYASWQGIAVSALSPSVIQFKLPNPLASFAYNLTVGLLPEHILSAVQVSDLRSDLFNTNSPIGAGPFSWHGIAVSGNTPSNAVEQIGLVPFGGYVNGKAKLKEFIVHAYSDQTAMVQAFRNGQLSAMAGLNSVPSLLKHDSSVHIHSPLLTAGVYVFFKTNNDLLSDSSLRKALVLGSSPNSIIKHLDYPTMPVTGPLLVGQLAYSSKYAQVSNQPAQAKSLLDQDGWQIGKDGYRYKGSQQLSFNLIATDTTENRLVGGLLAKQWQALGVNLDLIYEPSDTYLTTLQSHDYDSTLDGISIGNDPDVYVYWDGSQFDPRSSNLNLSEYNNSAANAALEAGRTRLVPELRVIKYQPFLVNWQNDDPALGLYQPRSLYITRSTVYGLTDGSINSPKDRLDNVQNWEILTANVTQPKT